MKTTTTVTNIVVINSTISPASVKMTAAMKAKSYHAYCKTVEAITRLYSGEESAIEAACASLSGLVSDVHGVSVDGYTLFTKFVVSMVKATVRKEDGTLRIRVNGIASFTKWVKSLFAYGEISVESNAGVNPAEKSEKKYPRKSAKERALATLASLPKDELAAIISALNAAA